MAGATIFATAPEASASVQWCKQINAGTWYCAGISGSYRTVAFCEKPFNLYGHYVYGPWMRYDGVPSIASCAWYEHIGSSYPQTR